MRTITRLAAFCAAAVVASPGARAGDDPFPPPWQGSPVGTLGAGTEASIPVAKRLAVTLAAPNRDPPADGRSAPLVDMFAGFGLAYAPLDGGFFVEAGVKRNLNRLEIVGTASQQGITASYRGEIRFPDYVPYVQIGVHTAGVDQGWQFGLSAGVLWQQDATVNLASDHPLAVLPAFQAALADQRHGALDQAQRMEFFPVISMRATYRF